MTAYDEPSARDTLGGAHKLAGVPQSALDAATAAIRDAGPIDNVYIHIEHDDAEAVAHAVLLAAIGEIRTSELARLIAYVGERRLSLVRQATNIQAAAVSGRWADAELVLTEIAREGGAPR